MAFAVPQRTPRGRSSRPCGRMRIPTSPRCLSVSPPLLWVPVCFPSNIHSFRYPNGNLSYAGQWHEDFAHGLGVSWLVRSSSAQLSWAGTQHIHAAHSLVHTAASPE
eukprot:GHVU01027654.1.p2 GENE.GHVU01027654.1~~GHVU01027654.1.p2  ORF type:complete len:107 (+),score=0.26 GHVU01027654.1:66-386(+)